MVRYRRLTLMEREEISRLLAVGHSLRATAHVLGRAPSTLVRELARHRMSPLTYRAVSAHQQAHRRAHQPRKPRKLAAQPRLRAAVFRLLARRWSPEQIAHGLLFTKQTKMKVYFAHPQCPWERGTNENTNGLLRQFFPAGTQFNRVSRREIKRVQAMLNDRPRKILNWHSPAHAFHQLLH